MTTPVEPFGFLNIDKPLGMTSHDVVAKIRRGLKLKRVGHAGTLDPLATGILIVCIGHATRLSEYAMNSTKCYTARVRLGAVTTTYDAEGEIIHQHDASHITQADLERILPRFLGEIDQIPPIYSAIKKDGKKLYELAREGKGETVELEPRRVTIETLTIRNMQTGHSQPEFDLDVVCSAGTYIRSLAYDIGEALGVGAHLAGLVRTASGSFTLDTAATLDQILAAEDWTRLLLPPETVMQAWETVRLSPQDYIDIQYGRAISASNVEIAPDTLARAAAVDGHTVAIVRFEAGQWKPHKVFM